MEFQTSQTTIGKIVKDRPIIFIYWIIEKQANTDQSTHTSVLCDETPVHQSRSSAIPRLSLLGKQSCRVTNTNFALIGFYVVFCD